MNMAINYTLKKNHLGDKKGMVFSVEHHQILHSESIILQAIKGTTITETDAIAIMHSFLSHCKDLVANGNKIVWDDFFSIDLSIGGVTEDPEIPIDKEKNELRVNAHVSQVFVKEIRKRATFNRVTKGVKHPKIFRVYDYGEDSTNEKLTIGDMIHISGENLKFDPSIADEGVYILYGDKEQKVKYRGKPGNRKLEFIMPAITPLPAACIIEVRCRIGAQDLRKGRSEHNFTLLKAPAA